MKSAIRKTLPTGAQSFAQFNTGTQHTPTLRISASVGFAASEGAMSDMTPRFF
jgi:hypothetical protein